MERLLGNTGRRALILFEGTCDIVKLFSENKETSD